MSIWSTRITSDAMITICTMIRIEPGIWLRIIEMNIDEKPVTKVTASAITKATCSDEVTASAEQMPSTCKRDRVVVDQRVDQHFSALSGPSDLSRFEFRQERARSPASPIQNFTRLSTPTVVSVAPASASMW